MTKRIISIQGNKGCGKDVTATFIKYLLDTPKILHNYKIAKFLNFSTLYNNWDITCYANKLKQMLAILLNVDVEKFEDRDFKENWYFDFTLYKFFHIDILDKSQYLPDKEFSRQLKKGNLNIVTEYKLSIRQILQCFGTDIMRRFFGDKLWVLSTLLNTDKNTIISDQRFLIENESVRMIYDSYIIHISRPGHEPGNHPSEKELVKLYQKKEYDVLITNDGTLEDLFNKCKEIIYNDYLI